MNDMSANDRAIKKSSENEPDYVPRISAKRLEGAEAAAVINAIDEPYPGDYTHVHVIDFPGYDPAFTWYRVNFYYEADEDPTTRIKSFIVTKDKVQ